MTRSEAGKLGYLASIPRNRARAQHLRDKYYENPKICLSCQEIIPYEKRANIYCNHSCRQKNGAGGRPSIKARECKHPQCNNLTKNPKYCSQKCCGNHKQVISFLQVEQGIANEIAVKNYLLYHYGNKCFECDLESWQKKILPMDLDHIDGDPDNNILENCRLLCPNCHRQTPTYKGGNGSTKKKDQRNIKRRKRYKAVGAL